MMKKNLGLVMGFIYGLQCMMPVSYGALDMKKLPKRDIAMVKEIIEKWVPVIQEKEKSFSTAKLTFEELYKPLDSREKQFVKEFLKIKPEKYGIKTKWRGMADGKTKLVCVKNQKIMKNGEESYIPPQFVPPKVYQAYQTMMEAMKKDLGKILLIDSGYRSSAYQLYLFIYYLQNHEYSIIETAKWNAFPGYSEHGDPKHQALDFINEEGINGENDPEEFAALPEYKWLVKNAGRFGFVMSYPKSDKSGIVYEPWHWRYQK